MSGAGEAARLAKRVVSWGHCERKPWPRMVAEVRCPQCWTWVTVEPGYRVRITDRLLEEALIEHLDSECLS